MSIFQTNSVRSRCFILISFLLLCASDIAFAAPRPVQDDFVHSAIPCDTAIPVAYNENLFADYPSTAKVQLPPLSEILDVLRDMSSILEEHPDILTLLDDSVSLVPLEGAPSLALSEQPQTTPPSSPTVTSMTETVTGRTTLHVGPGIALSTTFEAERTVAQSPQSLAVVESSLAAPDPSYSPTGVPPNKPVSGITIVGGIFSGLIVLTCITCILVNISAVRDFLLCGFLRRRKDRDDPDMKEKFQEKTDKRSTNQPWLKLPSSQASSSPPVLFPTSPAPAHLNDRVIDIAPEPLRSRWSDDSSDYARSFRSARSYVETQDHVRRSTPLMSPEEFFSLPSTTSLGRQHSRRSSAPVFGEEREGVVRNGRKSRSVSTSFV